MITAKDIMSHATDFYKDEYDAPIVFISDRESNAFGFIFDGFRERQSLILLMSMFVKKYPEYLFPPESWSDKQIMIKIKSSGLSQMDKFRKEMIEFMKSKHFTVL